MKPIYNITFSKPVNTFFNYLNESAEEEKAEEAEEILTIDGTMISYGALDTALKTGKGFMIGGFFVGATVATDMPFEKHDRF